MSVENGYTGNRDMQWARAGAAGGGWLMARRCTYRANGRSLECLTLVDDFTRECLDIPVDHGISGAYVARAKDLEEG